MTLMFWVAFCMIELGQLMKVAQMGMQQSQVLLLLLQDFANFWADAMDFIHFFFFLDLL